jgi:hypothetical protein
MSNTHKWILATSFATAAAGYLLPFWPLSVVGIMIAALSGRALFALSIGLLFDIAYGAPQGTMHLLYFPFTICAIVGIVARTFGLKYFLSKELPDTI